MNKRLAALLAVTLTGLFSATATAGFFDQTGAQPQGDLASAGRILSCTLIKTSFKGENAGFFSDAKKSVEASCLAGGGLVESFSASMTQWQTLRDAAGLPVAVYLSNTRLPDAKTDWSLLGVKPQSALQVRREPVCGPADEGKSQFAGKKVYSRGFRVGRLSEVYQNKRDWRIGVLLGLTGATPWLADKGSLTLGEACAQSPAALAATDDPMIFVYVQPDDDPDYVIEEVYRLTLTQP